MAAKSPRELLLEQQQNGLEEILKQAYPKGLTVLDIAPKVKSVLGYEMTRFTVRDRLMELVGNKRAHRIMGTNNSGSYVYYHGPYVKPDERPAQEKPVVETVKEGLKRLEVERLHARFDTIEKKLNTLIIRSEYSTQAMICIKAIAKELGVTVE